MAQWIDYTYIFSYWIFVWYLLYRFLPIFRVPLIIPNPKLALILGTIENVIMIVLMLMNNMDGITIFSFVVMNSIIKFIPLYTLWYIPIKSGDVMATFILFAIYLFWMHINGKSFFFIIEDAKNFKYGNTNNFFATEYLKKCLKSLHNV